MVTPTTLCCSPRSQVTLAEAVPVAGSGLTLPLDLFHIAARCNGAYFASKRFAAVQVCSHQLLCCFYLKLTRVWSSCSQLAYTHPRCRVLVFRTRLASNPYMHTTKARLVLTAPLFILHHRHRAASRNRCVLLHTPVTILALADSHAHVSRQAAPVQWPHGSPSHARSGSWLTTRACTCTRATSR